MASPSLRNAKSRTVTGASAKFADELVVGKTYRIVADVDIWYEFDVTGGTLVAAEDGAIFLPAGCISYDTVIDLTFLHVIKPTGGIDGTVNLSEVEGD